jgi:predicted transcriptional regulator
MEETRIRTASNMLIALSNILNSKLSIEQIFIILFLYSKPFSSKDDIKDKFVTLLPKSNWEKSILTSLISKGLVTKKLSDEYSLTKSGRDIVKKIIIPIELC